MKDRSYRDGWPSKLAWGCRFSTREIYVKLAINKPRANNNKKATLNLRINNQDHTRFLLEFFVFSDSMRKFWGCCCNGEICCFNPDILAINIYNTKHLERQRYKSFSRKWFQLLRCDYNSPPKKSGVTSFFPWEIFLRLQFWDFVESPAIKNSKIKLTWTIFESPPKVMKVMIGRHNLIILIRFVPLETPRW